MKAVILGSAALAVALAVSGCASSEEVSSINSKVEEVQAQQTQILARLDGLDKNVKQLLAKPVASAAAAKRPEVDPNKIYDVKVGRTYGNVKGPDDAPVTIVEFSDFQCPFCSQAASLVEEVVEAYPKGVRVVYKNYPLPFHKQAMPAAKAAVAAGKQGKFWEMHDKLFANYRALSDGVYTEYAKEIGLDVERFKTDMDAAETKAIVDADMSDARTAAVRGTPTFFINGKKPQGRSLELYKSIIDEELKKPSDS